MDIDSELASARAPRVSGGSGAPGGVGALALAARARDGFGPGPAAVSSACDREMGGRFAIRASPMNAMTWPYTVAVVK